MSNRAGRSGTQLWWVYPTDGSTTPTMFSGTLHQVVQRISVLHRATGKEHRSMRIE